MSPCGGTENELNWSLLNQITITTTGILHGQGTWQTFPWTLSIWDSSTISSLGTGLDSCYYYFNSRGSVQVTSPCNVTKVGHVRRLCYLSFLSSSDRFRNNILLFSQRRRMAPSRALAQFASHLTNCPLAEQSINSGHWKHMQGC